MLREPGNNTVSITRVGHPTLARLCRRPIHDGSTLGPWHGRHFFPPACPTSVQLPRRIFAVVNIACNFCGLQEIRFVAISLLMRDGLCFAHGRVPQPSPGRRRKCRGAAGLCADDRVNRCLHISSVAGFRSGFTGQLWLPLFFGSRPARVHACGGKSRRDQPVSEAKRNCGSFGNARRSG